MAGSILRQLRWRVQMTRTGFLKCSNVGCRVDGHSISTSHAARVGYQLKDNLEDCYNLLNVSEHCSIDELKEAYFKMAKMYHPDSKSSTADSKKFNQIKQAYKSIKEHKEMTKEGKVFQGVHSAGGGIVDDDDDDDEFLFKQQQAQHRQFLDNEGFGIGSRGDRQKQYEQMKMSRAQHNIYKYKVKKMMTAEDKETALVDKEKKIAKKNKMSNTMDRLVEDMITEAMSKGDFQNLQGAGKPLNFSKESPYIDKITQKMNQVLMDNDFQPDWIMIQKDIREAVDKSRGTLAIERKLLGPPPYEGQDQRAWETYVDNFRLSIEDVNEKVQKFNICVPMLHRQMMPYNYKRELDKVCASYEEYLPSDYLDIIERRTQMKTEPVRIERTVTLRDVLTELKGLFRKGENA